MAGQKAEIDKDSNGYLSKNSRPESEAGTAYHDTKSLEASQDAADEPGPTPLNFHGGTKKDTTRKADQKSGGTTGIGDAGTGLEKMESNNPFASVIKNRFFSEATYGKEYSHSHVMKRLNDGDWEAQHDVKPGKTLEISDHTKGGKRTTIRVGQMNESENPGQAGASATSDSPSLGMAAINNTDYRQSKTDVRTVLEGIALQAAEAFEALDENSNVPDTMINELQNSARAVNKIYEFANKNMSNDGSGEASDGPATAKDTADSKPGLAEDVEDLDETVIKLTPGWGDGGKSMKTSYGKLAGNQEKLDKNHNGKLDKQDFKMLRSKKTMKEAVDIVFNEILRGKLDGDN